LVAFSVYLYVIRTFSSMKNTRTPFLLNLVENGVNVATAFALYEWRGVEGLAWSWTIAYFVGAVVAMGALRRELARLGGRALATTALRVGAATVPAAAATLAVAAALGSDTPSESLVTLVAAGVAGGVVFVGCGRLAGFDLIALLRGVLRRGDRSAALPDG
jgi:putative peptidoglycan lipid II flippase